jgi:hypothetical protein
MDKFRYYNNENITGINPNEIFVFGSNESGIHGAGAAKTACNNFNAEYGVGVGFTGQCYALPTKNAYIKTLELVEINEQVASFLVDAFYHPDLDFIVTKVGTGLAGYSDAEIAPMFRLAPDNCLFHKDWKDYLE